MGENKDLTLVNRPDIALTVVDGVIKNLPEILSSLKDVYKTHKRTQTFAQIVEANIETLHINKENFKALIQALTELSKEKDSDPETKSLYREMIKALHAHFLTTAQASKGMADFLDKL